ncbi:uncharacterized protein LOC113318290 [Papaver somniferum]|uniref:uncharacterized protein LOC113318290 n=1 Tax=Papaver somniferum TaxID=3469 RepID=UPI000E6F9234|nr:uncharacterized protein LOC113318290 [Papaver somniferum]
MACVSMSTVPSKTLSFPSIREVSIGTFNNPGHICGSTKSFSVHYTRNHNFPRLLFSSGESHRRSSQITYAVDSGVESSITADQDIVRHLKQAKVVIESRDDDKIQVRVDLTGIETLKIHDVVIANLAKSAPPVPGFRKMKGGKTSNIPKSFILRALGEDRVTKFTVQEIVSATMTEFVKTENLTVNNTFKTIQSAAELKATFKPGKEFGFNATLDIEKENSDQTSSSPSEVEVLPDTVKENSDQTTSSPSEVEVLPQ